MKQLLTSFLILAAVLTLSGQTGTEPLEGTVTYVTSQSVYVKFDNTQSIRNGDTLYMRVSNALVPAMVVREHSSMSCVCTPISSKSFAASDKVYHVARPATAPAPKTGAEVPPPPAPVPPTVPVPVNPYPQRTGQDSVTPSPPLGKGRQQRIYGFASIASYSNFSTHSSTNSERMKYTVSLNISNIGSTGLSLESYVVFAHDNQNWGEIQKDIFEGLKIYDLSLNYDFAKKYNVLLGRKINPKLASMGAVDGLQFEMRFKPIQAGVLAGFRPDTADYGFNTGLFQFGGYLYNEFAKKSSRFMTTLGFIDQLNQGKTDRQFIYFQHSNYIARKVNFFGSFELDLYNQKYDSIDSTYTKTGKPKLTNIYASVNYRIIRQLSVSFSYSSRRNIIYYETYKNYLDRLLEESALQGFVLQITVRPVNRLAIGLTGTTRFMKDSDPRRTRNFYGYISYSQIPGTGITPTLSYTWLQTSYLDGNIFGADLNRDFLAGKLSAGVGYRYVDYRFTHSEPPLPQNMFEGSLTWRIIRKLALSLYYEGTFEKVDNFNRIYAQVNYRF